MIKYSDRKGTTKGVLVARRGIKISHILFAYDCILFCRDNLNEWRSVMQILEKYEQASGQSLNKQKTSIFFSPIPVVTSKIKLSGRQEQG